MEKTILRCFELTSSLQVNFHKSSLVGIHVEQRELNICASLLNCAIMRIPFIYLGLLVGVDARKMSTWQLIVDKMHKLTPWRKRHLFFGGRVCLVKSVLSFIPLYYLSIFKIPKKMLTLLNAIQRNLLWGARGRKRGCLRSNGNWNVH